MTVHKDCQQCKSKLQRFLPLSDGLPVVRLADPSRRAPSIEKVTSQPNGKGDFIAGHIQSHTAGHFAGKMKLQSRQGSQNIHCKINFLSQRSASFCEYQMPSERIYVNETASSSGLVSHLLLFRKVCEEKCLQGLYHQSL